MDRVAIQWVSGEIQQTVTQARLALEEFAEGSGDPERIAQCARALHTVGGVLEMLQFRGVSLLMEELKALALGLQHGEVVGREEAAEVLMRALVELPAYVEYVRTGHQHNPLMFLDLLNDARSVRGQPLMSENALFAPNLWIDVPALSARPRRRVINLESGAKRLRAYYQKALLAWFKSEDGRRGLQQMDAVVGKLEEVCGPAALGRLWWVARAVIEALDRGSLEASTAAKRLLAQLDRELKRIAEQGFAALDTPPPAELLRNLLYYAATADASGKRLADVKSAFGLDEMLLDRDQRRQARGSGGPGAGASGGLSAALREQVARLKAALEAFAAQPDPPADAIQPLTDGHKQLSDTLGLLGLDEPRRAVKAQAAALNGLIEAETVPTAQQIVHFADVLLGVDDALAVVDAPDAQLGDTMAADPASTVEIEQQRLVLSVVGECKVDMFAIKEAIGEFASEPQAPAHLAQVPGLARRVIGGLQMLSLNRAARLLGHWNDYASKVLLTGRQLPDMATLEALADSIVGIEHCLETVVEGGDDRESILASAESIVEELRARIATEDTAPGTERGTEPVAEDAVTAATPPSAVHSQLSDGVDQELLDVFTEEMEEVIGTLREYLPRWLGNPNDEDARAVVRRSYHTLKGSGRMVGATVIGEFAWAIENMLNRVIDGSRSSTPDVLEVVEQASATLPALLAELRGGTAAGVDVDTIAQRAESLAQRRLDETGISNVSFN